MCTRWQAMELLLGLLLSLLIGLLTTSGSFAAPPSGIQITAMPYRLILSQGRTVYVLYAIQRNSWTFFYLSAVVMVHTEFQGRNGYYRFLTTVQTRDSCHFHSVQEMHTYTCTIFTYYFSLPRLNNNGQFTWGDNMGGIMYNKLILFWYSYGRVWNDLILGPKSPRIWCFKRLFG